MQEYPLIKPKEVKINDIDGDEHIYRIGRFDCDTAREIIATFVPTLLPKVGDYKSNEKLMKTMMNFVEAKAPKVDGDNTPAVWVRLTSTPLRRSHIPDGETLVTLEKELISYNTNFLNPGKLSGVLTQFNQKLPGLITQMLTRLSVSLSAKK